MSSERRLTVVGAGPAGLAAAAEVGDGNEVTVMDRLPAPGGTLGYEHPLIRELVGRCEQHGVRLDLGTTAVRWRGDALLGAGPHGVAWRPADHLLYAGGERPATLAELPVAGSRVAGVLPGTVALHLLEAKVVLGWRPVVVGDGWLARALVRELAHQGARITWLVDAEPVDAEPVAELLVGWTPVSLDGRTRVATMVATRGAERTRLTCDAVLLTGDPRPLRNVDGAVLDPSPGVTFVQAGVGELGARSVIEAARRTAQDLREEWS